MNKEDVKALLILLNSRHFCSEIWLSNQLNLTGVSIRRYIEWLQSTGIEIRIVKGKGYHVAYPVTLFNAEKIVSMLPVHMQQKIMVTAVLSTGSTNDEVKRHDWHDDKEMYVCFADHQTYGRGRRGRMWQSPLGHNVYGSLRWKVHRGLSEISGLSLVMGISLIATLKSYQAKMELRLKWPNDVLWRKKKIAGVLIEVSKDTKGRCDIVLGVGVNLMMPKLLNAHIDQPITDLYSILGYAVDKNHFAKRLIMQIFHDLSQFSLCGFSYFYTLWNEYDDFIGKQVVLKEAACTVTEGICLGVDRQGHLNVNVLGQIKKFANGEISLRLSTKKQHSSVRGCKVMCCA